MNQLQIPKDWSVNSLENICVDIQPGFAEGKKDVPDGTVHLRMNNIGIDFKLNFDLIRTVNPTNEQINKYKLQKNDIVFNNTNSTTLVGKSALFDRNEIYLYSNHLTRLRVCGNTVLPKWLLLYLQYLWRGRYFEKNCNKWINQAAFNNEKIKNLQIPIPSLEIQKKIIEKLDYILEEIEEKKREIFQIINKFDVKKIHQSYQNHLLNAAFSGKLTNEKLVSSENEDIQIPKGWKLKKLGEIGQYKYGYNGKATSNKNGKPYLRITDINEDGSLKPDRVYVVINNNDFQKYRLQHNDIVIARTGATVGKSFLFTGTDDFVFASYLIRFRFDSDIVIPKFLLYVLKSNQYWNFIGINQSASAQPNVNATKMSNFEFLLPPMESQKKIVQILDEKFQDWNKYRQQIENIEQRHQNIRKSIDSISTAILNSAFSGKLVN